MNPPHLPNIVHIATSIAVLRLYNMAISYIVKARPEPKRVEKWVGILPHP
nr:MAG TPA: hypothetical protein [Caudoviricetes sp.]